MRMFLQQPCGSDASADKDQSSKDSDELEG